MPFDTNMLLYKIRKKIALKICICVLLFLSCKTLTQYREGSVLASPHGDLFIVYPYPLPNNYTGEAYWWLYKPKFLRKPDEKPVLLHKFAVRDGQIVRYTIYWPHSYDCIYRNSTTVIAPADSPCSEYLGQKNRLAYGFSQNLIPFSDLEKNEEKLEYKKP